MEEKSQETKLTPPAPDTMLPDKPPEVTINSIKGQKREKLLKAILYSDIAAWAIVLVLPKLKIESFLFLDLISLGLIAILMLPPAIVAFVILAFRVSPADQTSKEAPIEDKPQLPKMKPRYAVPLAIIISACLFWALWYTFRELAFILAFASEFQFYFYVFLALIAVTGTIMLISKNSSDRSR